MLWKGQRQSDNVEDRRGMSGGGMAIGAVSADCSTCNRVVAWRRPATVVGTVAWSRSIEWHYHFSADQPAGRRVKTISATVLASTEDVWADIFRQQGRTYSKPTLVLFTECGAISLRRGGLSGWTFLLSWRSKLYLDLSFFNDLQTRFRAPEISLKAYVIAHEVGHHVQNLLGTMDKVDAARGRMSEAEANQLSVRLELQADFLAGVLGALCAAEGQSLRPATLKKRWGRPVQLETTGCSAKARATSYPTHLLTELQNREFAGSKGLETGDCAR